MTPDEINALHASGTQFPLDSDKIDAAVRQSATSQNLYRTNQK